MHKILCTDPYPTETADSDYVEVVEQNGGLFVPSTGGYASWDGDELTLDKAEVKPYEQVAINGNLATFSPKRPDGLYRPASFLFLSVANV